MIPFGRIGGRVGAYAQAAAVDPGWLAPLSTDLDDATAATLPLNALTARQALDMIAAPPGATLLVTGASGAVGGFATQLAVRAGLRVLAQASYDDEDWVASLGADRGPRPRHRPRDHRARRRRPRRRPARAREPPPPCATAGSPSSRARRGRRAPARHPLRDRARAVERRAAARADRRPRGRPAAHAHRRGAAARPGRPRPRAQRGRRPAREGRCWRPRRASARAGILRARPRKRVRGGRSARGRPWRVAAPADA